MEAINLELQIVVNKPDGMDRDVLLDKLTYYIYEYQIKGADIQTVQINRVNGLDVDN